uniref:Heterogeneous nuclear ribonucleoprotein A1 n=1 Tax=Parastrongyloides trichosuri TaxID=131310 RepID=A0A0N4Z8P6_PARTI
MTMSAGNIQDTIQDSSVAVSAQQNVKVEDEDSKEELVIIQEDSTENNHETSETVKSETDVKQQTTDEGKTTENNENNGTTGEQPPEPTEPEHFRKIFIGGLTANTNEEMLKEFFSQWGGYILDCVVMRDPSTKRSRGFGFVTYVCQADVDKAMINRPHNIDGKVVDTKRAVPRDQSKGGDANLSSKRLYVSGIRESHTEEMLTEHFKKFGNVLKTEIINDKQTEKPRGFAFVTFDDYDCVDKCVLIKSHMINDLRCDVKKAVSREEMNRSAMNDSGNNRDRRSGGGMKRRNPNHNANGVPNKQGRRSESMGNRNNNRGNREGGGFNNRNNQGGNFRGNENFQGYGYQQGGPWGGPGGWNAGGQGGYNAGSFPQGGYGNQQWGGEGSWNMNGYGGGVNPPPSGNWNPPNNASWNQGQPATGSGNVRGNQWGNNVPANPTWNGGNRGGF